MKFIFLIMTLNLYWYSKIHIAIIGTNRVSHANLIRRIFIAFSYFVLPFSKHYAFLLFRYWYIALLQGRIHQLHTITYTHTHNLHLFEFSFILLPWKSRYGFQIRFDRVFSFAIFRFSFFSLLLPLVDNTRAERV